jgi:CBS domain-containing protein
MNAASAWPAFEAQSTSGEGKTPKKIVRPSAPANPVRTPPAVDLVGSVVLCDPEGEPVAMITDRDLAIRALAENRPGSEPIREHASRPLVTGEPEMELEEAAALMVQHRIRRLPVVEDGELAGIVTLDDIAVRTGNLEVAQRMTQEVIEGALPGFFFHERG